MIDFCIICCTAWNEFFVLFSCHTIRMFPNSVARCGICARLKLCVRRPTRRLKCYANLKQIAKWSGFLFLLPFPRLEVCARFICFGTVPTAKSIYLNILCEMFCYFFFLLYDRFVSLLEGVLLTNVYSACYWKCDTFFWKYFPTNVLLTLK